ncbi:MAG TPA: hypothetical protein ENH29_01805 [Bacteroidetes bacterium]|nr:hypothetical protein [Bacteroidota bacterium]
MKRSLKNQFSVAEWSGAVGDLGTMLPLAFALIIFNQFPPQRLFFLWGLVYLITGWYYRVPVAVQPLKAMAVIAIASGFSVAQLSSAAFFYGILMVLLSATGAIRGLERWFSPALVRGVQLGIGLILLQKALMMIHSNGVYFNQGNAALWVKILLFSVVVLVLFVMQFIRKIPVSIFVIAASIGVTGFLGLAPAHSWVDGRAFHLQIPQFDFLFAGLIYLMIPQLPLTLGNAVFAANDACHSFWREQAKRVSSSRLGFSIGLSNIVIGLLGGFPICHGAGGIAAHAKFGAKTGGSTIIIGSLLIIVALINPLAEFLFYIPIPILGAMLLFTSWSLMALVKKLPGRIELMVAVTVGAISFFTRNLTIALLAGLGLEYTLNFVNKRCFVVRP